MNDREELAAALANHDERRTPYSDLTIGPIVAAARRQLPLEPVPCEACGGTRIDYCDSCIEEGPDGVGHGKCPTCNGRGWTYKLETVERIAGAMFEVSFHGTVDRDYANRAAVAALDALRALTDPIPARSSLPREK